MHMILLVGVTTLALVMIAGMERDANTGKRIWCSRVNRFTLLFVVAFVLFLVVGMGRNVHQAIQRNKSLNATSEIANIERTLTKLLADAGKNSLNELFDPPAFEDACAWYAREYNANAFEARVAMYTRAAYTLFHHGRGALTITVEPNDPLLGHVQRALNSKVVRNMGASYMLELGDDLWGNPYQIFSGSWPNAMGAVLFRSYRENPDSESTADSLTVSITGDALHQQGFPASSEQRIYIWSFGANGISDQPRYDPTHEYASPARQHYRQGAPDEFLGGGDDINNWDQHRHFMMFYD